MESKLANTNIFNPPVVKNLLLQQMNAELLEIAEPILQEALAKMEQRMRDRIASRCISMLSENLDMNMDGTVLRIQLHQAKSK